MPAFGKTRPYPATELNSQRWVAEVPVEAVSLGELCFTQDGVMLENLLQIVDGPDPYPHVVRWQGKMYLENGHSRVARALIQGVEVIQARVFAVNT